MTDSQIPDEENLSGDFLEAGASVFIEGEVDEELVRNSNAVMLAIKAVIEVDKKSVARRSAQEFYFELQEGLIPRALKEVGSNNLHLFGLKSVHLNSLRSVYGILERNIEFVTYIYKYMFLEGQAITIFGKTVNRTNNNVPRFSAWLKSAQLERTDAQKLFGLDLKPLDFATSPSSGYPKKGQLFEERKQVKGEEQ